MYLHYCVQLHQHSVPVCLQLSVILQLDQCTWPRQCNGEEYTVCGTVAVCEVDHAKLNCVVLLQLTRVRRFAIFIATYDLTAASVLLVFALCWAHASPALIGALTAISLPPHFSLFSTSGTVHLQCTAHEQHVTTETMYTRFQTTPWRSE